MALGETSQQFNLYQNNMKPTKDHISKKVATSNDNKTPPIEEHSSLLFAMRSAFREKLALQMNSGMQKQKNRSKHKQMENESSLLQLCEKNKKLMQEFNENSKENARRKVASDQANRRKKLPPISHQSKSVAEYSHSRNNKNGEITESSSHGTHHFHRTERMPHHNKAPLKNNAYNTISNEKSRLSSISSNQTNDRQLDDSPPDMTKLRIVRNKRKHELMRMHTKLSSPAAMMQQETVQTQAGTPKSLVYEKPKQKRHQNSVTAAKTSFTRLFEDEYESDFQNWQKERDKERQIPLNKLDKSNNNADRSTQVKHPHSQAVKPNVIEFKQFPSKPIRKNIKRRQEYISASPGLNYPAEIDNTAAFSQQTKEDIFSKPMRLSPDSRASKLSEKNLSSPLINPTSVIPGLHRPVLVRRDGRSNSSSRTSTRNAFYTQNKAVPPMEGERETLEKIAKKDSQHMSVNAARGTYDTSSIPEQAENVVLLPCRICGRKFRAERIDKHVAVCAKSSTKKRKVFNMSKARKKGTDLEKFTSSKGMSRHLQPQPRKSNWRHQHEDFIKTIRHAKMISSYVKGGGNLTDLPPPEPSANPDYVTCDYCQRRFAPHVAERHIAKCKNIKSRPPPPKSKMPRNKH